MSCRNTFSIHTISSLKVIQALYLYDICYNDTMIQCSKEAKKPCYKYNTNLRSSLQYLGYSPSTSHSFMACAWTPSMFQLTLKRKDLNSRHYFVFTYWTYKSRSPGSGDRGMHHGSTVPASSGLTYSWHDWNACWDRIVTYSRPYNWCPIGTYLQSCQ